MIEGRVEEVEAGVLQPIFTNCYKRSIALSIDIGYNCLDGLELNIEGGLTSINAVVVS